MTDDSNKLSKYDSTDLVIGLVGAVGTNLSAIYKVLVKSFEAYGYKTELIKVVGDIIIPTFYQKDPLQFPTKPDEENNVIYDEFERIWKLMDAGDKLRRYCGTDILGIGANITKAPSLYFCKNSLKQ